MSETQTPLYSRRQWMLGVAGAASSLASCGGSRSSRFYVPPRSTDTLTLYDLKDPPTLDPARSWGVFDGQLIGLMFSTLVRFGRDASILPDLAQRWTISEDGLTYTFDLHPNALFSNGDPVTSQDVRYSFERIFDEQVASPSQWVLERIKKITTPNNHKLVLELDKPFAPFLGLLAMPAASIVPKKEVDRCEREGIPFGEHPVGSGPWIFEEWKHDQSLSFLRNESHWGTKPHLRRLVMRIISNEFTAIAEFETGNLGYIKPIPTAEINRWRTHPQWSQYTTLTPILNTDMILINCKRPPFDQPELRRALCQVIETPLLLEAIREGAGTVAMGSIPPGLPGHSPDKKPNIMPPTEAKAIFKKYGLDKRGLELLMPSAEDFIRSTGEVMQALWKQAGLKVNIHQLEWVTYRQALRQGDYDTAYRGWYADYPDGDNFLFPLFHSSQIGSGNMSFYADAEADALIERSQTELDPAKRTPLLEQANDRIYQQAPALFLWHEAKYIVTQPWLHHFNEPLIFNGSRYLDERIVVHPVNENI